MSKSTPKYIIWNVTRSHDHHYPVIMSANGKPCLNEAVKRKASLQLSIDRFLDAAYQGSAQVETRQITEAEFRKKFPRYPVNAGPKKKAVPKTKKATFHKGQKVFVNAGVSGKCEGTFEGYDEGNLSYLVYVTITKGPHKGALCRYDQKHITAR